MHLQNKIGKLLKEKPSVEGTYCLKRKKGGKGKINRYGLLRNESSHALSVKLVFCH